MPNERLSSEVSLRRLGDARVVRRQRMRNITVESLKMLTRRLRSSSWPVSIPKTLLWRYRIVPSAGATTYECETCEQKKCDGS
jgi:hypothetical protein